MEKKSIAISLIIVGVIMMAWTGFSFVTKKKVVDLGTVEIKKEETHNVNWPPILGVLLIVGGIVVLATSKTRSSQ